MLTFIFRLAVVTDEGALNLWIIPAGGLHMQVPNNVKPGLYIVKKN